MFQNYITTAIRSLMKNKQYSIINIGGLALGLAACILITLFVRDELSYDKWLPNGEDIYKLDVTFNAPGRSPMIFQQTPGLAAAALEKYSEVDVAARIWRTGGVFDLGERQFGDRLYVADADIFKIFDIPMAYGDREEALASNTNMLLSEKMATKYFGVENAVGKTILFDNDVTYKVVGVFKDMPNNTHVQFDNLVLLDENRYASRPWIAATWTSANVHTYVRFTKGTNHEQFIEGLPQLVRDNVVMDFPGFEAANISDVVQFRLTNLHDIHLKLKANGSFRQQGDITAVITFSAVAVLILVIASINFINLATARAMKRAREVSLRKVLGATRGQLVGQFLGEAILTTFLGLIIAIVLVQLTMPFYNNFLQKDLALNLFSDFNQTISILGLALFVGIVGGGYPAFFLSSFRPAKVLRSNKSSQEGSPLIRNGLVVVQFAISIALMVSTAIIYGQTLYAQNIDLGFNKDHKLIVQAYDDSLYPLAETIKNEFLAIDGVKNFARASDRFPQNSSNGLSVKLAGVAEMQPMLFERMSVGPNFFPLYGVKPIAGRIFDENRPADLYKAMRGEISESLKSAVVNKTVLGKLGIASPEAAIGKVMIVTRDAGKPPHEISIIGVIDDLHTRSLHHEVTPMVYFGTKDAMDTGYLTLDLQSDDLPATLAEIDTVWARLAPEVPIARNFVDDDFDSEYQAEEQRGAMFAGFALFAVFVACLGLYGLASYAADRRTKEIGLRKVLGASITDIMKLLLSQFSVPVLIAMPIAWVSAYLLMQDWLQAFPYRIDIFQLIGIFPLTGLIALCIAWGTVAHRAHKVAKTNPVVALHYE